MFNNIFCEMTGKKVIHLGGWGNGGTVLITSWKCNFSIYLDIQVYYLDNQAITALYAFYWLFMCCFLLFSHFSTLSLKSDIFRNQKDNWATVFNLQALDWFHCEEETGAHLSMSQFSSKLVSFFYFNFETCLFWHKKMRDF